jgi:hypothetical protein
MNRSILTTMFFSGLVAATASQAYIAPLQQAEAYGVAIQESFARDLNRVSKTLEPSPRVDSDAVLASFVRDLERDGLQQGDRINLEQKTSLSASDAVLNSFVRDLARN